MVKFRNAKCWWACLAALGGAVGFAEPPAAQTPEIRRVMLNPDQVGAELEKVQRGSLRSLPLSEFEDLLRRAQRSRSPSAAARIITAKYQCRLQSDDLIGSAIWTVRHSGPDRTSLRLEPFSIAIRTARWLDDRPAIIANPGVLADDPEVHIEGTGDRQLYLDWSARGIREPGGVRFSLHLPACATAVLELDLPKGLEPIVPRDQALVTRPAAESNGQIETWRLAIANLDHLDLTIADGARRDGSMPLVLSRLRTRQDIGLAQVASEFVFELEIPNAAVQELAIACDPDFQPIEIVARNLDGWDWSADTNNRIIARWREPYRGGTLTLRGFSPVPRRRSWSSPSATVVGAVACSELLTLNLSADVRLDDWSTGSFRTTDSSSALGPSIHVRAGTIRNDMARPSARIVPAGAILSTQERLWWRLDTTPSTLTAQLTVEAVRGVVAESIWRLPSGWTIDRVDGSPPETLGSWRSENGKLTMEWARPCTVGKPASATVRLSRRASGTDGMSEPMTCPELIPIGSAERTGFAALKVPFGRRISAIAAMSHELSFDERAASPWGSSEPNFVLPLQGAGDAVDVRLVEANSDVRAEGSCRVVLSHDKVQTTYRLRVAPSAGAFQILVLHGFHALSHRADWRAVGGRARIRSIDSLSSREIVSASIGAVSPWPAALTAATIGDWHQIAFTHAMTDAVDLEMHDEKPLDLASPAPTRIPVFQVGVSKPTSWHITVDRRAAPEWDCRPVADNPAWIGLDSNGCDAFLIDSREGDLQIVPASHSSAPFIDSARLTVDATLPDRLRHKLEVGVWRWNQRHFPLLLPSGAENIAFEVDGRSLSIGKSSLENRGILVELPAPASEGWNLQVRYSVPSRSGRVAAHLAAQAPILPVAIPRIQVQWLLPREWEPARRDAWMLWRDANARELADQSAGLWSAQAIDGNTIWIVWTSGLQILAWAIAIVGLILGTSRDHRVVAKVALVAGIALALAAIWLPAPWTAVAVGPLIACAVLILRPQLSNILSGSTSPLPWSKLRAVSTVGLVGAFWLGGSGRAAVPPPVVVYVLPDSGRGLGQATVLVPPHIPDLLRSIARRAAAFDRAVPFVAEYTGKIDGTVVQFTARIQVFSFQEGPADVALPLSGAVLRAATLDGTPTSPITSDDRITVTINGRGSHTLELKLTANCPEADDREVHFTIPELPASHLTFVGPGNAANVRTVLRRGAETVTVANGVPQLNADIGPVGAVHIRWNREPRLEPTIIRAKEAYLWDLHELSARLLAVVQFAITGSTRILTMNLPADVDVTAVTARALDADLVSSPSPWLRNWNVSSSDGSRRLTLNFSAPIAGNWQVHWESVPRRPFPPAFALSFPRADAAPLTPAVYAYRGDELDLAETATLGLSRMSPDEFLSEHWSAARAEQNPQLPTRAYVRDESDSARTIRLQATAARAIPPTVSPAASVPRPPVSAPERSRPAPQSGDEALTKPHLRLHAVDVVCADTGHDQYVHRLSASVSAIGSSAVAIIWPDAVEPLAIAFNDERLAIPVGKRNRIVMPIDQRHNHGTLRCVWLTGGASSAPRPGTPRIEIDGRAIAPETQSWSIIAPPGKAVTAQSPPVVRSAGALSPAPAADDRLPFAASFREGTANTWTVAGDADIPGLQWVTDSAGWFGPMRRTAALAALAALALLARWRVREWAWPELLATLALAGWIATGAGFWFAPLAFAIVVRATQIISTRQVVPQ